VRHFTSRGPGKRDRVVKGEGCAAARIVDHMK